MGVKVFQNDTTLDEMYKLEDLHNYLEIHEYSKQLLTNLADHSYHLILLGVSLVDASINGTDYTLFSNKLTMYGYYQFFVDLSKNPMYDLLDLAKNAINILIEQGVASWTKDVQEYRMNIYRRYKERLESIQVVA